MNSIVAITLSIAMLIHSPPEQIKGNIVEMFEKPAYEITADERYLIARVVKCESGNKPLETQMQVASSILNRTEDERFPNTIKEVIYSQNQYTPTMLPSWWNKWQPDENSYKAVDEVIKNGSVSDCLYFEDCKGSSWHSRNLKLICNSNGMRFYK